MDLSVTIQKNKVTATLLVLLGVADFGILYQYAYHQRRDKYEKIISGYYRQYFEREPDTIGLRHWTTWALNKWDLEKIRLLGFEEVRRKGID